MKHSKSEARMKSSSAVCGGAGMKPIKTWVSMDETTIGLFKDGSAWCVLWKNEASTGSDEWNGFGGSVGYSDASFTTEAEAIAFVETGLREELRNPEIWLDMVAV